MSALQMREPIQSPADWRGPEMARRTDWIHAQSEEDNAEILAALAQQRFPEIPRLTPRQLEALKAMESVPEREDLHFTMMFQPGDLQLLNNHVTLHGRTGFEDYDEPDRKRHLFRLWLAVPNSRPLSPSMAEFFRDGRAGAVRGGFPAAPGRITYESLVE